MEKRTRIDMNVTIEQLRNLAEELNKNSKRKGVGIIATTEEIWSELKNSAGQPPQKTSGKPQGKD